MTSTPNTIREDTSETPDARQQVELNSTPKLGQGLQSLTHLKDALLQEDSLTAVDLRHFHNVLGQMTILVGDDEVPLSTPDFAHNLPLWHQLLQAESWGTDEDEVLKTITLLPPSVARTVSAMNNKHALSLQNVTTLELETVTALAQWKGVRLSLASINNLSPEVAKALAAWSGSILTLEGMTTLDLETAKIMVNFSTESLKLSGLRVLEPAVATSLARWPGLYLILSGLTTLDSATAEALAQWSGLKLSLSGLISLDASTAQALASWSGEKLRLFGLTTIDTQTAHALAQWSGDQLDLDGLTALDPVSAMHLARFSGDVLVVGEAEKAYDAAKAKLNKDI